MLLSESKEQNIAIEPAAGENAGGLYAALNRYCLSLTGSRWDAEDLAHDTWLKAIGTLRGRGHSNEEAFMLRIAKNTWIDQTRRKTLMAQILQRLPEPVKADQDMLEIESAFQALRKHLSPLQRAVFLLRDVFAHSSTEAAGLLGTTDGAVKAALHRARQALRCVREDLEKGSLPMPEEESLKWLLRALASAYRSGDVAKLVALVQQDALEPAAAVGIVQTRLLAGRQADIRPTGSPTARMAA